ncbi:MAG: hypothetical protein K2Q09_06665, partial [Phycisphaerales bacterium]|nr:hypothetical protein [Phycisphaerales bacterium]
GWGWWGMAGNGEIFFDFCHTGRPASALHVEAPLFPMFRGEVLGPPYLMGVTHAYREQAGQDHRSPLHLSGGEHWDGGDISSAFQSATCAPYVSGQSWLVLGCSQSGFSTLVGADAEAGTVRQMATVADYTMMGKKPIETFSESIFLIDEANAKVYLGSGTFSSYAAVLKVSPGCGAQGFAAGMVINAELTTNEYVGGAVYFVPTSFHGDEASAEKAAAALSADDPGDTGDYPPNMSPSLVLPDPNRYVPGPYIPRDQPPPPDDHWQRATGCYNAYRAACRVAFTSYKNTLAAARSNRLNGAGAGAATGAAYGGGAAAGLLVVWWFFTGPPGWTVAGGVIALGGATGGAIGAVGGPATAYSQAREAAKLVLKNDVDPALAAYRKGLESSGWMPNPNYH